MNIVIIQNKISGIGRSPRNSIRLNMNTSGSSYAINSSQCSLAAAGTTGAAGRPRSQSVDRHQQDGGTDMYERVSLLGNGEANDAIDETSIP